MHILPLIVYSFGKEICPFEVNGILLRNGVTSVTFPMPMSFNTIFIIHCRDIALILQFMQNIYDRRYRDKTRSFSYDFVKKTHKSTAKCRLAQYAWQPDTLPVLFNQFMYTYVHLHGE